MAKTQEVLLFSIDLKAAECVVPNRELFASTACWPAGDVSVRITHLSGSTKYYIVTICKYSWLPSYKSTLIYFLSLSAAAAQTQVHLQNLIQILLLIPLHLNVGSTHLSLNPISLDMSILINMIKLILLSHRWHRFQLIQQLILTILIIILGFGVELIQWHPLRLRTLQIHFSVGVFE